MTAITGNYRPAKKLYGQWAVDWLYGWDRWTSPRHHLAVQLQAIRREHGSHEAAEFRNYLLWLAVYPTKVKA